MLHYSAHQGRTRYVASVATEKTTCEIRTSKSGIRQLRHNSPDIAASANHSNNRFWSIFALDCANTRLNKVVCFVPGDALPLVLATFADAFHWVGQPVTVMDGFGKVQTPWTEAAIEEGVLFVSFDLDEPIIFGVVEDAATFMASRPRPTGGSCDGELAFLPLPGFLRWVMRLYCHVTILQCVVD